MNDERTFVIDPIESPTHLLKWYAGSVADGRLVLFGQSNDALLEVIWFTPQGTFLKGEKVPIPKEKVRADIPFYPGQVLQFILDWQKHVGFRSHPITVRHFHLDQPFHAGIRLLFSWDRDFLRDPYYHEPFPDGRQYRHQSILDWLAARNFVLYWGREEFGFNKEGIGTDDCPEGVGKPLFTRERLYCLQTSYEDGNVADFYAGRLADGRQALLGVYLPKLVLVLFDAAGNYLEYQTRPLADGPKSGPVTDVDRAEFVTRRQRWQRELGWQEQPIQVRRFALPEQRIYLADYPEWATLLLYDPYSYPTPQERAELRRQMEEWDREGCFVFWWSRDYHMNKDGEVLST
jgi:hypothetical protein